MWLLLGNILKARKNITEQNLLQKKLMNLCKSMDGVLFQGKRKTNVAKACNHRLTFDPLAEANGNKKKKTEIKV
jgi:hypothetical protein